MNRKINFLFIIFVALALVSGFSTVGRAECVPDLTQFARNFVSPEVLTDLAELLVSYESQDENDASRELALGILIKKLESFTDLIRTEPTMVALRASGIGTEEFEEILSRKTKDLLTPYTDRIRGIVTTTSGDAIKNEALARVMERYELAIMECAAIEADIIKGDEETEKFKSEVEEQRLKIVGQYEISQRTLMGRINRFFGVPQPPPNTIDLALVLSQGIQKRLGERQVLTDRYAEKYRMIEPAQQALMQEQERQSHMESRHE